MENAIAFIILYLIIGILFGRVFSYIEDDFEFSTAVVCLVIWPIVVFAVLFVEVCRIIVNPPIIKLPKFLKTFYRIKK